MNQKVLEKLVNDLSLQFFDKPFTDNVAFNMRLRTTGGRYIPSKRKIELNPKYIHELGEEEFIGIVKHELCHYHLHIEGKGYQHKDQAFKELLKKTNSPRHCNPLPSTKDRKRILYRCKGCGHEYYRTRRIDVNKYRCGKCRGTLSYVEE
ncbi:SprT family protein [Aquibacillus sp. 3ASR75-11]|uniref:Protein SprT-like n=1 Tax=Terrihalobacillus insolitus TaxID=2950438 RepID=A0A9X4ANC6_9BACI|nr:SprT family protein [Terrihalobacillus insolitus]MDC3415241.1 SprT family protein [Terrihalobacillus insolitus]MDC3426281.1 SprT family protein [Terrihalobacillus insolitus]